MTKVQIKIVYSGEYGQYASVDVLIDGQSVGHGSIGGEPEDNSIERDYKWIRPTIQSLAEKLGAEVEVIEEESGEDDDVSDL